MTKLQKFIQNTREICGKDQIQNSIIKINTVTSTTDSIIINITKKREAELKFFIKVGSKTTNNDDYISITPNILENDYTFEQLDEDTQYCIKIEAIAIDDGTKEVKYVTKKTLSSIIENVKIQCEVTYSNDGEGWRTGTATATARADSIADNKSYIVQTQKDSGNWENKSSQNFDSNGTMYARVLYKNSKVVGYNYIKIDKLDNNKPTITSLSVVSEKNNKNIILTLGATDSESGIIKIIWHYKKINEENYNNIEDTFNKR